MFTRVAYLYTSGKSTALYLICACYYSSILRNTMYQMQLCYKAVASMCKRALSVTQTRFSLCSIEKNSQGSNSQSHSLGNLVSLDTYVLCDTLKPLDQITSLRRETFIQRPYCTQDDKPTLPHTIAINSGLLRLAAHL